MKKIICAAAILLCSYANAQIELMDYAEEPIPDNYTFTTSTTGTYAKMNFLVTNTSDAEIKLQIRVDEITNSSGEDFQLCFYNCYTSIEEGTSYPPGSAVTIAPGATTPTGDHFINSYGGDDGVSPVSAKFTFVQVDDEGNVLEELYKINYQYVPQLSVSDAGKLQQLGISNVNTLVESQLNVDASEATTMEIFNLNGQLVRKHKLEASQQSINVSDLTPAMYVVRFTDSNNKSAQIKIAKK